MHEVDKKLIERIIETLNGNEDENYIKHCLIDSIMLLNVEEIKYFSDLLKNINSIYFTELFFIAMKAPELKQLIIDSIDNDILNKNEIKNKIKDFIDNLFKDKNLISNKVREYLKNTNVRKVFGPEKLEEIFNEAQNDFIKDFLDIEKETNKQAFADFIEETCKKEDISIESIIARLISLCDVDVLEEETLKYMRKRNTKKSSETKKMEEILENLSTDEIIKILQGKASVRIGNADEIPLHLKDEFDQLLENSLDPNTNTIRIDTTKVSKELLNCLKSNSTNVF